MRIIATADKDRPGLLLDVLKPFAARHINLCKVNGFHDPTQPGRIIFHIQADNCVALDVWWSHAFNGLPVQVEDSFGDNVPFPAPVVDFTYA